MFLWEYGFEERGIWKIMERIKLKKGVNLGGWMSQCDYSEGRLNGFITEEDIKKIASWWMDHVRLPVDYNVIQNEDGSM